VAYVSAGLLAGLGLAGSGLLTDPWLTLFLIGAAVLVTWALCVIHGPYGENARLRWENRNLREDLRDELHDRLARNCAGFRQAWQTAQAAARSN